MKKLSLIPLIAGVLLSGCSVMHFKNGSVEAAAQPVEKWHHNMVYSLLETGAPLDAKSLCSTTGNWSMITTKETFITGLAGAADGIVSGAIIGVGLDIWDPQMVEYTCGK